MQTPEILKDNLLPDDKISGLSVYKNPSAFRGVLYESNDDGFGNQIFTKIGDNQVVFGGAVEALRLMFNSAPDYEPPTINTQLGINAGVAGDAGKNYILAYGVGTGGSGNDFGSIVPTDVKAKTIPGFIPLRATQTLPTEEVSQYFMKAQDGSTGYYYYYLKLFDVSAIPSALAGNTVIIKTLWKDAGPDTDGTEVLTDISGSALGYGLESFAEASLHMTVSDAREYFVYNDTLNTAKFNSIGLFTGQVKQISAGYNDIVNCRLFSYLNFNNRPLQIPTDATFLYRIYALT